MTQPALPPGFRQTAHLGRGGTAVVVRALSERLHREVALKIPLPESEQTDETPFSVLVKREQTLIGRRRFPGLVRLLDSSEDPPYVAMEICSGPTLDTLGKIDNLPLALNLLSALALDLEFLRAAGIVHGDLKPQNVFLPTDYKQVDGSQLFWVKLSDFSLGRRTDETDTDRVGLGTVGYMAPETIVEGTADHRSDLFALGVVAYQALTGVHPFMDGETDPVTINSRCREEEPTPVHEVRPEVGEGVGQLVAALLQKDSSKRPESAWEVCIELERLGAEYPFRHALGPAHLLVTGMGYDDIVAQAPLEWADYGEYLKAASLGSPTYLRLVLAENFRRGNLMYDGSRFGFQQRPYWPCRLRRKALATFASSPLSKKRTLIRAAVTSEYDYTNPSDAAIAMLLRPLLRPATVRRLSAKTATQTELDEKQSLATLLAVQAGDLEQAERCCYQAVMLLQKEHAMREALRLLELVIDFARLEGREFEVVSLMRMKGELLKGTGETEEAYEALTTAISCYDGRKPDRLLGRLYNTLGDVLRMKQKFSEGIESLQQALRIYEEVNDELEVSHTYNNIGNMHFVTGNAKGAIRHYRRALRIQRHLAANVEVASTLGNLGAALGMLGRFGRAIVVTKSALKLKREFGDMGEIAYTLNNLGYLYSARGERAPATEALRESLELHRKIGNRTNMLSNLETLTSVMIAAGNLKESLGYVEEGLDLADILRDVPHRIMFSRLAAVVLRRMGHLGKAEQQQAAAEELIPAIDDREEEVRLMINAAALRSSVGETESALHLADRAASEAQRIGSKPELLNAYLLRTRLAFDDQTAASARSLCRELRLDRERILVLANQVPFLVAAGQSDRAEPIIEEIEPLILDWQADLELPRLLLSLVEWRLTNDDVAGAQALVHRANTIAHACALMPEQIQALTLLSRMQGSRGNYEEAFRASRQALGLCKQVAEGILDPEDRRRYQETPAVQSLVTEIRQLQARIGQKKGAGK